MWIFPDQDQTVSPALVGRFLITGPPGKSKINYCQNYRSWPTMWQLINEKHTINNICSLKPLPTLTVIHFTNIYWICIIIKCVETGRGPPGNGITQSPSKVEVYPPKLCLKWNIFYIIEYFLKITQDIASCLKNACFYKNRCFEIILF